MPHHGGLEEGQKVHIQRAVFVGEGDGHRRTGDRHRNVMFRGLHRFMAEQFSNHEQVVRGGVCRGSEPVTQRVRGVPIRQQAADVVPDIGLFHMAAEPTGEQIPLRLHDDVRQVIRQRHDTLLVAFAAHDKRMAGAVGHHVIAVNAGDLPAPQPALGAEPDHKFFRRRGHPHRHSDVTVRAWPGVRVRLLHPGHVQTRIIRPSAAFMQPSEERRYGVPVCFARLRFPLLPCERLHDLLRGHVFGA